MCPRCRLSTYRQSPTLCRRSVPLRPVPDAPLKVLHPLPVISLELHPVARSRPSPQYPKSGPSRPQALPCPCPLIHAQKCDTASPTCGPCRRSRANLECSYDPTSVGPHPLHLRRGQACLPCRCVIRPACFRPSLYRTCLSSRKKKVISLLFPISFPSFTRAPP